MIPGSRRPVPTAGGSGDFTKRIIFDIIRRFFRSKLYFQEGRFSMKRLVCLCILAGFLLVLPATHLINASKSTVMLCHYDNSTDLYGHYILVSDNGKSVSKHLAHGDCYYGASSDYGDGLCRCP
jgi:hypothetical protein